MNKIKMILKVGYWFILIALIFVAGFTALTALNIPGGYKMFVVQSGSMEPTIKTGSVVIIKPQQDYQKGDIITFKNPDKTKETVTHRIFSVTEENKSQTFTTKGDANKTPDTNELRKGNILGKEIIAIPFAGYLINFFKTMPGLIAIIAIATIIIYSELMNIKKEALRLIEERRNRKLTVKEEIEEKIGEEIIKAEKEVKKVLKKKSHPSLKTTDGKK